MSIRITIGLGAMYFALSQSLITLNRLNIPGVPADVALAVIVRCTPLRCQYALAIGIRMLLSSTLVVECGRASAAG